MNNISIIVAMGMHRVIGINNELPWHLPADLKHFKQITLGHTVIMGRMTYESICKKMGGGLPQRTNIVISKTLNLHTPGFRVVRSMEEALDFVGNQEEAFVIGGEQIYRLALPFADKIYQTFVCGVFDGDAFFPTVNAGEWEIIDSEYHGRDEKNNYPCCFSVFKRRASQKREG